MPIITRLFNQKFNIYRITSATPDSTMFEFGGELIVKVRSNVSGRLSKGIINELVREGAEKPLGAGSGYKYKLFVPQGTDIRVGDRVALVGSLTDRYIVDYVNDFPGGEENHHVECLVSYSDFSANS